MAQQVVHTRMIIPVLSSVLDFPSIGFTFEATGSNVNINLSDLHHQVDAFWASTQSLLGPACNGGQPIVCESYDVTTHLDGTPAGSPIDIHNVSFTPGSSSGSLPEGVAAVISWRAAYGSAVEFGPSHTRPRARLRNRCYFGPLKDSALGNESTTNRSQLQGGTISTLGNAVKALAEPYSSGPEDQLQLVVWSRVGAMVNLVEEVWLDDRPDYQRRRSDPSNIKTVFSV